jgi:hypothetical protein
VINISAARAQTVGKQLHAECHSETYFTTFAQVINQSQDLRALYKRVVFVQGERTFI